MTLRGCSATAAGLLLLGGLAGCQPPAPAASSKPAPPATVSKPPKEADLSTVTLAPEAEKRLGLVLAEVARRRLPRTAVYGGEVIIPPGQLIAVASPFVGVLKAPGKAGPPVPGQMVKAGQVVFSLSPRLSPESRATMAPLLIEAEGQAKQAAEQLKVRKIELDRAENLVRDRLGGQAALVDAKAQYDLAQAALRAAERRREILAQVATDAAEGSIAGQTIESPADGVIQNVHALVGQTIAANAPLFEVAKLDPVWIKVPVYVGDAGRLATDREASIGGLADAPGAASVTARPAPAPPSGDPLSSTVNLFYQAENGGGALRPGQRVGATLPLKGDDEQRAVPRAALLRDIHGGTWVYESVGPHAYARRRVEVDRVVGDWAALAAGPAPGRKVVTDGAAELFGAEFGNGK